MRRMSGAPRSASGPSPPSSPVPSPAVPTPPKMPIMKGGAREHILDIVRKYTQPLEFYFGVLLFLGIIYVGQIPAPLQYFANTILGRAALFLLTIAIADMYSWIYAVLMALFTVLLIAVAPRTLKEAFESGNGSGSSLAPDTEIKLVTQKQKWFIERTLGENPVGIEEEKVRTSSIQDGNGSSNSTTSSSGR
jgi:hypothetical protein